MATLIFAAVAIFVLWRLWSVLGTRTGQERPRPTDLGKPRAISDNGAEAGIAAAMPSNRSSPSIQNDNNLERWKGVADPGTPKFIALDQIARQDPGFVVAGFLGGAKRAYEMIVVAFATGDRKTLQGLLSKDVFDSFSAAISSREARGETVQTTFVSLDSATIEDAQFKSPMAQLTVKFSSKLITVSKAADGTILDGSPDRIGELVDVWTFARDITQRDPNWRLIATETGH